MKAFSNTLWLLLALVALVGAIWIVYGRTIDSPLIFDDKASVNENPSVVRLWPLVGDAELPAPLNPAKDSPTAGRPLVNLSLALNYHFGRLNPSGYHLFNILVHVLSALLLMAIVRRTLCLEYFGGRFDRASGPLALAVALLWAVHPLQTETVVYITQRTELLVGFFYLATLYGSLRYWAVNSKAARTTWLTFSTLTCLAGMACKEVMVTAPVIVLLFERTFIAGSFRKSWPLYVGLFLSWVLLIWLNIQGPRSNTAGFDLGISAFTWWLTQTKVWWLYLKLAVWPWPLSIHYEMPYLTTLGGAWPWLVPALVLAIAAAVLLWRRNAIGFAGAWILIILSPTLVVPIVTEAAAERRMYLPLAALLTLAVVGGFWLVEKLSQRFTVVMTVTVSLLLATVLSIVSIQRLAAYQSALSIWQDVLALNPDDVMAHNNLAVALNDAGRPQEALAHCQRAVQLDPHNAEAEVNMGNALVDLGNPNEAIEHYRQALQIRPDYADAYSNLGLAMLAIGRPQNAIELFAQSLRLKPTSAELHFNLGNALLAMGRPLEAVAAFNQAVQLDPDNVEIHNNLGAALAKTGRLSDAVKQFEQTLNLQPDVVQHYINLAKAYAQLQEPAEAIDAATKGLNLARSQGQSALVEEIERWLAQYRADRAKPFNNATPNSENPSPQP